MSAMLSKPRMRPLAAGLGAALFGAIVLLAWDRVFTEATANAGAPRPGLLALATLAGGLGVAELAIAAALLLSGFLGVLAARAARGRVSPALAASLFAGAAAVYPFLLVGRELSSGDWIAGQSYAFVFHWGPAVFGALGVAAIALFHFHLALDAERRPAWRVPLLLAGLASSALPALANTEVWFGLYPRLHMALSAASALLAYVSIHGLLAPRVSKWATTAAQGLALGSCVALGAGSFLWLDMDRSTRSEIIDTSATCVDAARALASFGERHSLLADALERLNVGRPHAKMEAEPPRGRLVIPRDWNIVLIIGDALRADALPPVRGKGNQHAMPGDTPFLDRWLEGAIRFRKVYSQAACTARSMPPFFRSLEAYDDAANTGAPLGTYMKSLGRKPIAAVTSFFLESRLKEFNRLVDDFEDVEVYHERSMEDEVPNTLRLIERNKDTPFFAWLHFYCLHVPGWADGHVLTRKDCNPRTCYRRSLKWLDGQMEKLMAGFDRMGLEEKTVFVLAADHGQSLGEKRAVSHGANVWEETVRVPLAFRIPGRAGRVIDDAVVGNIDVVPTLADLSGAPAHPAHRGRSLVPLLVDASTPWKRDYYTRSRSGEIVGLVRGRYKLVHDEKGDAVFRYDVEADPGEQRNLFDESGELDQSMLRAVLVRSPEKFKKQLAEPATRRTLLERLRALHPKGADEDVGFLFELAVLEKSPEALAEVRRIFSETRDLAARLLVIRHAFATDKGFWSKEIAQLLEVRRNTPDELDLVRRLVVQGQPAFSASSVARRMSWWASKGKPADWEPWLTLLRSWKGKTDKAFRSPLVVMVRRSAAEQTDPRVIESLLERVANVSSWKGASAARAEVVQALGAFLDHPDPGVQAAAISGLGLLRDTGHAATVRAMLEDTSRPLLIRVAALHAVGDIGKESAVPVVARAGEDPLLTMTALDVMRDIGSPKGIPFVKKVSKENFHFLIRGRAKYVLAHLEKRAGQRR